MMRAALALGSNLGDRLATLRAAVQDLSQVPGLTVLDQSSVYETAPVGPEQPDYLNAVVIIETTLAPEALLDAVQAIEFAHGRVRIEHWGPRTLDIDIIDFEGQPLTSERLVVPHPLAIERAFVLVPLAEVAPDWQLSGRSAAERAAEVLELLPVATLAEGTAR